MSKIVKINNTVKDLIDEVKYITDEVSIRKVHRYYADYIVNERNAITMKLKVLESMMKENILLVQMICMAILKKMN